MFRSLVTHARGKKRGPPGLTRAAPPNAERLGHLAANAYGEGFAVASYCFDAHRPARTAVATGTTRNRDEEALFFIAE